MAKARPCANVVVGVVKVGRIESIEHLRTELELQSFRKRKHFHQREIEINCAGAAHQVPRRGAEGAERRGGKGRSIEIALYLFRLRAVAFQERITHQVRERRTKPAQSPIS